MRDLIKQPYATVGAVASHMATLGLGVAIGTLAYRGPVVDACTRDVGVLAGVTGQCQELAALSNQLVAGGTAVLFVGVLTAVASDVLQDYEGGLGDRMQAAAAGIANRVDKKSGDADGS